MQQRRSFPGKRVKAGQLVDTRAGLQLQYYSVPQTCADRWLPCTDRLPSKTSRGWPTFRPPPYLGLCRTARLISRRTAEKIQHIAKQSGYRVSAIARGLVTQRTKSIGVVVTTIADPFVSEVVNGIEDCCNDHGYSVFLANSNADPGSRNQSRPLVLRKTRGGHRGDFFSGGRALSARFCRK